MTAPDRKDGERPRRVQLSRAKGWRMPANTVKVDRTTAWGNPWRIEEPIDMALVRRWGWTISPNMRAHVCACANEAALRFEHCLLWDDAIHDHVREALGGRHLACWCPHDQSCHSEALLWLANSTREQVRGLQAAVDAEILAGHAEPMIAALRRELERSAHD